MNEWMLRDEERFDLVKSIDRDVMIGVDVVAIDIYKD